MAENTFRPSNVDRGLVQAPLGGLTEEEVGFAISEDELKAGQGDEETTVVVETEEEITQEEIEEPVAPVEFFGNLVSELEKQTLDKIIEWEKFILKSKKCDFICNKQINEYLNNFKI